MKFSTKVDCPSYDKEISHVIWEITPEVIEKLKQFGAVAAQIREICPDDIEHVAFKLPNAKRPGAFVGVLVKNEDAQDDEGYDDTDDDDQPFTYGELVEFQFEDVFSITGFVDEGDAFSSATLKVSELAKLMEVRK